MTRTRQPGEWGYRLKPITCPWCDNEVDAATEVREDHPRRRKPQPGDFSICIMCSQLGRYLPDMTLARATDAEIAMLARDHPAAMEEIRLAQRAVRQMPRDQAG